ncbi:hypothetical protein Ade02nite_12330 [Paractinoplanes deccanensis]|uniref:Uncharacterized protein n=1 Tax=Paractinoplanes deccanensis TaxID=113561 RepID=A0ABQ3XY29_9ACTN|nr:hypothetical protein [Actinoplanes deccanensis]GID72592.1 hypothetical protein Ade02nite_12330 [Actinoplanes deccanensis]
MERQTRALPQEDLAALLGLVVVVDGELLAGRLPPELTERLISRLLPAGASAGELNAALSDLAQRLHWAAGHGVDHPPPMRHTGHELAVPAGAVAACVAALREMGAESVREEPGPMIVAAFPELAPDPAYERRVEQLTALAATCGGEYRGASW